MKFAIILLGCLSLANCWSINGRTGEQEDTLAEGFRWGKHWDSTRRYECQYVSELRVISCFRGMVECETVPRFEDISQNYEIFAIGSTDMVNFQLYPRNFSDLVYQDAKIGTPAGQVELRLFSSEEESVQGRRGLMVKDARCFKRIIESIKVLNNPAQVELQNRQKVNVLSYIVNLEGEIQQHPQHGQVKSGQEEERNLPFGQAMERQAQLERENSLEKRWRLEDSTSRNQCKYVAESEMLICFRGLVKCETEAHLDQVPRSYEVFGLGSADLVNYKLYPRNHSDVNYSDYRVQGVNGKTVELSLLRSGVEGQGLMVRDAVCYQRIVDTLRVISEPVMVDVTGDNTNTKVQMMGSIVNLPSKQLVLPINL